jgi:hypothetical protein
MLGQGYIPGENTFETFINDGALAALMLMATGKAYNPGQRFGSVGLDQLREFVDNGLSWKIMGGASFSWLHGMWEGSDSLRTAMGSMIRGDGKAPLKIDDILDVFGPIKSLSDVRRFEDAINTTKWVNKRGLTLAENVSPLEALLMSVSGVQRSESASAMDYKRLEDQRDEMWRSVENEFLKHMNRRRLALETSNVNGADTYLKKAEAVLEANDYPLDLRPQLWAKAAKQGQGTVTERAERKLRYRGVPLKEQEAQQQIFMRREKLKGR